MIESLSNPAMWVSLLTLTLLEVVLGIDNIVFISILSGKLPAHRQKRARRWGLIIGMIVRLVMLSLISLILKLEQPIINIDAWDVHLSGKDLILLAGGLFLIYQSTKEIHHKLEGEEGDTSKNFKVTTFSQVIIQLFILNFVFSIDSVITAIGMAKEVWVMMGAVIASMLVMLLAAEPISDFVNKHPTIKILALSFLILIGFSLIGEGFGLHIPKGYIYFAMAFSFLVDMIQLRLSSPSAKPIDLHEHYSNEEEKIDKEIL